MTSIRGHDDQNSMPCLSCNNTWILLTPSLFPTSTPLTPPPRNKPPSNHLPKHTDKSFNTRIATPETSGYVIKPPGKFEAERGGRGKKQPHSKWMRGYGIAESWCAEREEANMPQVGSVVRWLVRERERKREAGAEGKNTERSIERVARCETKGNMVNR